MKVEIEDMSSVEKKVSVEIPAERVKDEFELAYNELQKKAQIKGFRPGKAPMKLLESQFKDYVKEKVMRKLLEETITPALERKQLKPILEPALDLGELKEDAAFRYTIQVEVKPVVELKQYTGFELEREQVELTEAMVESAMNDTRERQAVYQDPKTPRGAQKGDLLTLDLKAEAEGKELKGEGGAGLQYTLGEQTYIPGFAEQLEGLTVGETRSFRANFPPDHYRETLKGKEVAYRAELKGLKEKILPELTDEFAKESGYADLAEMRTKLKAQLQDYYERMARVRLERALLDKLVEFNPLEAPKRMVHRHAHELARNFYNRLGIKEIPEGELEKMAEESEPRAEKELKAGFILEAVIAQESLTLDPAKEAAKLADLAQRYQVDAEKLKDQMGSEELARLHHQWLEESALDFLLGRTIIKDKVVKPDAEVKEGGA